MAVTTAQLDGYFKRVYGDAERVVPKFAVLQEMLPFEKTDKIGDSYRFPVKLSRSHGFTWAGGSLAGTGFTLNAAISMVTKEANATGSNYVHRETIAYGAVSRSGGQEESYGPVVDETVMDIIESARFQHEMAMLYGGSSIGTIEAISDTTGERDFTITGLSWAPGLFAQSEGMPVDVYDPTLVTKRNTNADIIVGIVQAANTVRKVTVTGNEADLDACAVNDVIVPKGAVTNWFTGLDKICTNTGSLFGIDAAVYGLWRANTYSAGSAPLTISKVQNALNTGVVRGLMEPVVLLVNTFCWTDMMNDLSALKRFGDDTSREMKIGSAAINFAGANGANGFDVVPHPMVKAGEAFLFPKKRLKRIGSTDVTFKLPDAGEDRFVRQLENSAAFEVRCFADQALVPTAPAKFVKITNIVPSSLAA